MEGEPIGANDIDGDDDEDEGSEDGDGDDDVDGASEMDEDVVAIPDPESGNRSGDVSDKRNGADDGFTSKDVEVTGHTIDMSKEPMPVEEFPDVPGSGGDRDDLANIEDEDLEDIAVELNETKQSNECGPDDTGKDMVDASDGESNGSFVNMISSSKSNSPLPASEELTQNRAPDHEVEAMIVDTGPEPKAEPTSGLEKMLSEPGAFALQVLQATSNFNANSWDNPIRQKNAEEEARLARNFEQSSAPQQQSPSQNQVVPESRLGYDSSNPSQDQDVNHADPVKFQNVNTMNQNASNGDSIHSRNGNHASVLGQSQQAQPLKQKETAVDFMQSKRSHLAKQEKAADSYHRQSSAPSLANQTNQTSHHRGLYRKPRHHMRSAKHQEKLSSEYGMGHNTSSAVNPFPHKPMNETHDSLPSVPSGYEESAFKPDSGGDQNTGGSTSLVSAPFAPTHPSSGFVSKELSNQDSHVVDLTSIDEES